MTKHMKNKKQGIVTIIKDDPITGVQYGIVDMSAAADTSQINESNTQSAKALSRFKNIMNHITRRRAENTKKK